MKKIINKEDIINFFKKYGVFILFCIVLLWISLLLVQISDAYIMLEEDNTRPIEIYKDLFSKGFGTIASLITIIPIVLYTIIFCIIEKKEIDISKIFLLIVIPLGIMHMFVNPLGRVPDEDTHIRRAYEISCGYFITGLNEEGQVGRELPADLELITKENQTYNLYEIHKEKDYGEGNKFFDFNNTAVYTFICYLPQAIGISIARLFGGSIALQAYAARFVNFSIYVAIMYLAIKKIPFKKLAVFMIAFLPITIQEAASISPDALTNAISIFFVSYVIYHVYSKEKLTRKDYIILAITSVLVALVKIIYLPLCALIFLLPNEKFETKKKKYIILCTIFAVSVILNLVWLGFANSEYKQAYNEANPGAQIKFILEDPYRYIVTCFRDVHLRLDFYINGLVGEYLSYMDIKMSFIMEFILLLMVIFSFIYDENGEIKPNLKVKGMSALVILAVIALLFTSEYISWNPVGNFWVNGVQPRYYIPILLLVAVLCNINSMKLEKRLNYKYIYMLTIGINLHAIISLLNIYMK